MIPLRRRLKEVPVPLMMLYGTHDRKGTAERCALLREKEPALRMELIQNAGHLLMWDVRGIFHQKILDVLST
jgi:pimeloyl-ACP methyl ester carboxylesterase